MGEDMMKIKIICLAMFTGCLFLLSIPIFAQKLIYDNSFTPDINGGVDFVKILSDQKILIAGSFTVVNGVARSTMARLNPDGSLDEAFNASWVSGEGITAMSVAADGKIYIAGNLRTIQGNLGDHRVLRLNPDGSFDSTLTGNPRLPQLENTFPKIRKVEQLPNGKFLICGKFTNVNFNPKANVARFDSDGSFDSTFTTVINNECEDVEVQPNGKYLVSGYYTTVNGSPRGGLTRFNTDDSIDTGFTAPIAPTNSLSLYRQIELLNDGTMYAFNGDTRVSLSRLNADGSNLMTYSAELRQPGDIQILSNGKLLVTGEFTDSNFGQSRDFNRFNTDGTHDPSLDRMGFRGWTTPNNYLKAVEIAADEKVIVGGHFTNFDVNNITTNRAYLARFTPQAIPITPKFDFDGDGKDDLTVYRPSDRVWYVNQSTNGFFSTQFGLSTDKPVVRDYDGDGRADIAVFRDGVWYWQRSSDNAFAYGTTGQAGDIPQPDYSRNFTNVTPPGLLVFRPSEAKFYTQAPFQSAEVVDVRSMPVTSADKPVIADYDGDGLSDIAVFRDGNWFFVSSSNFQVKQYQFGLPGDKPVRADYDGDGRADYAVFRPSTGVWYIQQSTEGFYAVQWGLSTDLPVPGDYDGDGKTDIAVYRDGIWYILHKDNSIRIEQFGLAGDIPAQLR
jgi:uncharacterized delta-60 repeat protein